ncbi:cysteine proteinase inhibitor 12 [Prunus yedoensis var. nudiflora]|uniref:Cysteine proteinase inhibitor n=1 Tax=Prunus yedoensis var. nudiflora TaxID=2094558 RepID=A0A314Z216_PRUYE|nr:cysteine proteinase inhibitor 12 [Prunus yedoensis var. nudiflora]
MKLKSKSSSSSSSLCLFMQLILFVFLPFLAFSSFAEESNPSHFQNMATLGGVHESHASQNSLETEDLARFAVQDHNNKENALLEFVRVVKAKEQVVAGTLHHLTIEAIDAGKKKLYEAKVWVKPWMGFKEVQEFKHAGDCNETPSFTPSDLGVKEGGHGPGWQSVPPHDPSVVHAKAEVIEEHAKFNMLLKLKRGDKEEKFKVEVHKNNEGAFKLNQMEADHS